MIYKLSLFIIHNIKTCQNIVVEMLQLSLIPINEFTIYIHTYLITKINISRYCQYIYMHMPTIIILILKYFIIYIVIY